MAVYPVGPLTLNIPKRVQVDAGAQYIEVHNDSANDVYVLTGPNIPDVLTTTSDYKNYVRAWGDKTWQLYSPQASPIPLFDGNVFLLATNAAGLATTGTSSIRNNITIVTYTAGETPINFAGIARQADLTSQPRVISIPTMPHIAGNFLIQSLPWNQSAGNVFVTLISVGPGVPITVYLYSISLLMTKMRYGLLGLYVTFLNGGGVSLASTGFYSLPLIAGQLTPPLPQPITFGPQTTPALTASVGISIAWLGHFYPATGTALISGTLLSDIDITGQTPPPAIGNGTATPVGVLY